MWVLAVVGCAAEPAAEGSGEPPAAAPAGPQKITAPASQPAPGSQPSQPSQPAKTYAPSEAIELADGSKRYGGEFAADVPVVELASLLESPRAHLDAVVRTTGHVARVCKRMGCWLELRPAPDAKEALRVPMAGHAFYIPQSAIGRQAEIEGTLTARELTEGHREHLGSEGAQALGPLSLAASAVRVVP